VLAPLADVPVALVEAGLLDEVLLAAGGNTAGGEIVVAVELAVIIDPERRGAGRGSDERFGREMKIADEP